MGYVNFNVDEEYVNTILNIAQDVYGIKGTKFGLKIPTSSITMPYFISECNIYLEDDNPNARKIIETILKLTYDIHGKVVSALVYKEVDCYVRTISIKGNGYTFDGELKFYSDSIETLINMDLPNNSFIKWQIYEGRFKERGYNL